MKVEVIKAILQSVVECLDDFDDNDEIELASNYGGMEDFIYIDGVQERGFMDMHNIKVTEGD